VPLDYNPIGDESRRACEYLRSALGRIGIAVEVRPPTPRPSSSASTPTANST
jgi:hypothetical protein